MFSVMVKLKRSSILWLNMVRLSNSFDHPGLGTNTLILIRLHDM